jgi:hypothetical protein
MVKDRNCSPAPDLFSIEFATKHNLKGNSENFVTHPFMPSARADAENSFAAVLENKGGALNLHQKVPNLALDHLRFHKNLANYNSDNIEISLATAQVTMMRAGISSTNAVPEIWSGCRISLPFPVQESFVHEEGSGDVHAVRENCCVLVSR